MQAKLLTDVEGLRTWAVVFDTGEEVVGGLTEAARRLGVRAAEFTAIGAFSTATLAWYDWDRKEYIRHPAIDEQTEAASVTGNVSLKDGSPTIHAHGVLGMPDGSARAGHLMEARARPTLQVMLTESPTALTDARDPETGLMLIDIPVAEDILAKDAGPAAPQMAG
jgi:hypothetical protein